MSNRNPFKQNTLTIYESHPLDAAIPSKVEAIEIWVDYSAGTRPRPADIGTVLAKVPAAEVRLFSIDSSSELREVPDLRRFSNLEYLHLAGRKLASPGDLSFLGRVHTLFIVGAKDSSLAGLRLGPLENLRLIRGNTEILDVPVGKALLQSCQKLREFGATELRILELEGCHHVDLATLSRVRGLKDLQLLNLRRIDDFSFLRGCRELVSLQVAGSLGAPRAPLRFAMADFRGLGECPSLRNVGLQLSNARIQELAAEFPHLLISNGGVCFHGSTELPGDAWRDAVVAERSAAQAL
jgi:hypothetical protein